jgi:hypothetical protein
VKGLADYGRGWKRGRTGNKRGSQVIARAVPSSLILNSSWSKFTGVPDKLLVMLVMAAARAVIVTQSALSVLMVGVAEEEMVVILAETRLLLRVSVLEMVGTFTPSTAIIPAAPRVMVVSELPTSIVVMFCVPVNVLAASVLATVKAASGRVIVLAAVGPEKVICCPNMGSVLEALGIVTLMVPRAPVGETDLRCPK